MDNSESIQYFFILLATLATYAKIQYVKRHGLVTAIALLLLLYILPKCIFFPILLLLIKSKSSNLKKKNLLLPSQEFLNDPLPCFRTIGRFYYPNNKAKKLLAKIEMKPEEFFNALSSPEGTLNFKLSTKSKVSGESFLLTQNGRIKRYCAYLYEVGNASDIKLCGYKNKFFEHEMESNHSEQTKVLKSFSQDIMNQVCHVIGFLGILNDSDVKQDMIVPVKTSLSSSEQIFLKVHDLMDYVSIKTLQFKEFLTNFKVDTLFSELFDLFNTEAKMKGILLTFNTSVPYITIMADYQRLKQLFTNMIQNSIRFTNSGFIKIDAVYNQAQAVFTIEDCGIRINKEGMLKELNTAGINDLECGDNAFDLRICQLICEQLKSRIDIKFLSETETVFSFFINNCVMKYKNDFTHMMFTRMGSQERMILNTKSFLELDNKKHHIKNYSKINIIEHPLEIPSEYNGMNAPSTVMLMQKKIQSQAVAFGKYQSRMSFPTFEVPVKVPDINESKSSSIKLNNLCIPVKHKRGMSTFFQIEEIGQVLIVDDDKFNRMVVDMLFKDKKISTTTAASGMDALRIIKEEVERKDSRLKLIIMDINMPEMSGLDCSEMMVELWKSENAVALPIIALSASISDIDSTRGQKIGLKEFIRKPITSNQVCALINKYVK